MNSIPPPSQIQTIGILHLIGGILNLISGVTWVAVGFLNGILSFGIGCVFCLPAFISLPVGIFEIISGARHLSPDHRGLKEPRMVAIMEIASFLGCSVISGTFGIITLMLLNDPQLQNYYRLAQLDRESNPARR